jgi:hypothetical protein
MPELRWKTADRENQITFEYSDDISEKVVVRVEEGVPGLYGNVAGLTFVAKVLAKMAAGPHVPGFHVHLGQNLDPDAPEMLRIILTE